MSITVYYEKDVNKEILKNKTIAVIGYGSQGAGQSLNLRDSNLNVILGLRKGGTSWKNAEKDGWEPLSVADATKKADIIQILIPDELQAEVYHSEIAPNLEKGNTLMFSHGFNIHFNQIEAPKDINVIMVAPKGPGHTVRGQYKLGSGVPCLIAIENDVDGDAKALALAYADGVGGTRAGVIETSFKEETETDLFGEQAVLCGGISALITAGFETLVDAGYAPEMAYFECLHETKLITDLIFQGGLSDMRYSVSNTAEYGDYISGSRVINASSKAAMKDILTDIQTGKFARDFILENKANGASFKAIRRIHAEHPIEKVGKELRKMMPFLNKNKLITEDRD